MTRGSFQTPVPMDYFCFFLTFVEVESQCVPFCIWFHSLQCVWGPRILCVSVVYSFSLCIPFHCVTLSQFLSILVSVWMVSNCFLLQTRCGTRPCPPGTHTWVSLELKMMGHKIVYINHANQILRNDSHKIVPASSSLSMLESFLCTHLYPHLVVLLCTFVLLWMRNDNCNLPLEIN